ncbi:MAG TPA: hypothetical protein EYP85_09790 [Armatimonadetes bacterium]|nr:hypothetical protein [Armatimonadota bacterium]
MLVRFVVFGSGAVLMATEILGFRVIGKTFGTALREYSAVIAVFLGAMSLGYYLGGRWGDRWPRPLTLVLVMVGGGVAVALVPVLDPSLSTAIADSSLPLGVHALLTATLLFSPPALLLASVSPIAIRLLSRRVEETGRVAGSVAAVSTVGSILGTLLTGFYLIGAFRVSHTLYGLGGVMVLLAACIAATERWSQVAAVVLAGVFLGTTPTAAEVIFERDSPYHHILVQDEGGYRTLYFDNSPESRMLISDPLNGAFEYTDFFHLALVFHPQVREVLMLGLGGGSIPKRFVHDYPQVRVDAVDVDPLVIEVAQRFFAVQPGPRLNLIAQDARVYLRRTPRKYDFIALDAYTTNRYGSTVPFHLTTQEFFALVKRRLTPRGVIAYNIVERPAYGPYKFLRAMVKTMSTQFPTLYLFEAEGSYNTVIFATQEANRLSGEEIVSRARRLVEQKKVSLPHFVRRAGQLYSGTINTDDVPLLTDDYAPVDDLLRAE